LLHSVYCAEYEHTSKILLTGGKNYVPLYTVQYLPKELKKKGFPIPMRTAVWRTYDHKWF